MRNAFHVHVKLIGQSVHELPVLMDLGGRVPEIGDFLEIPMLNRVIRARVAYLLPATYRGLAVIHDVYTNEVES